LLLSKTPDDVEQAARPTVDPEDAKAEFENDIEHTPERDDRAAHALMAVLEACEDGETGYRDAASLVRDHRCQRFFEHHADERARFARAIDATFRRLRIIPAHGGSARAALHRDWLEAKAILTIGSAKAIVSECRRGEDAALETYRAALHEDLPPDIRAMVEEQYEAVKRARAEIAALADGADP
jgi:uncharacterized protein (TIGR02284 family)